MSVSIVAGLLTLFVRQLWWSDHISYYGEGGMIHIALRSGQLKISREEDSVYSYPAGEITGWEYHQLARNAEGFAWWFDVKMTGRTSYPPTLTGRFSMPVWFLILLFSIKPTWSVIAWRRRRRFKTDGHLVCASCGYDLHGIEGNRCPECGEGFSSTADN